jgi:hypothetical protein
MSGIWSDVLRLRSAASPPSSFITALRVAAIDRRCSRTSSAFIVCSGRVRTFSSTMTGTTPPVAALSPVRSREGSEPALALAGAVAAASENASAAETSPCVPASEGWASW